jgi:hypothetical protein
MDLTLLGWLLLVALGGIAVGLVILICIAVARALDMWQGRA